MEDYQKYLEQITEEYNKSKRKAHRCLIIFFSYLIFSIILFLGGSLYALVNIMFAPLILLFTIVKYAKIRGNVKLNKTRLSSIGMLNDEYNKKLNEYIDKCEQINMSNDIIILSFNACLYESFAKSVDIIVDFEPYYTKSKETFLDRSTTYIVLDDIFTKKMNYKQKPMLGKLKDELIYRNDIFYKMLFSLTMKKS